MFAEARADDYGQFRLQSEKFSRKPQARHTRHGHVGDHEIEGLVPGLIEEKSPGLPDCSSCIMFHIQGFRAYAPWR